MNIPVDGRNFSVGAAMSAVAEELAERNPLSAARQAKAEAHMPGGNTRTLLYYTPFPIAFARGEGARLWDVDGHEYLDLVAEQSAAIFGHTHPRILAEIESVVRQGINLGGPNKYEAALAEAVTKRFSSIEHVRFCSSGTEANMFALATARAATGREKIMAFATGYHGGLLTFTDTPGPLNAPFQTIVAPYNDLERTYDLIKRNASDLAAVILEPMMGGGGCLPGSPEFLTMLRSACDQHGIVLIFDEVMTSRLGPNGLQGRLGIRPDLTTLGKYIGGGMNFGGFGGRRDLMARYDPRRADHWNHAGTFNNNVLTMAAGVVGLTEVFTEAAAVDLNERGDRLRQKLNDAAARNTVPVTVTGIGSLMNIHFSAERVTSPVEVARANAALKPLLHLDFLLNGVYLARRGFIALSMPVTDADVEFVVTTFRAFLERWSELITGDQ